MKSIAKIVLVVVGNVAGVSAADDLGLTFPGSSKSAVDTVKSIVSDVTSDAGSLQGGAGGAGGASDREVLDQLIARAKKQAVEAGLDDVQSQAVRAVADLSAKVALRKQTFIGGCARDFSACPSDGNWELQNGECVNVSGIGYCASISASASVSQKEDFAWRCSANFACSGGGGCKSMDFSSCPQGWSRGSDGLCVAPSGYSGICSPAVSFSGFSDDAKLQWASMCGAQFPCARGRSFLESRTSQKTWPVMLPPEIYSDVNREPTPHVNIIFDSEA